MSDFFSTLKVQHIKGSYYKICGGPIVDLSAIFNITPPFFVPSAVDLFGTLIFTLESEFGASATVSFPKQITLCNDLAHAYNDSDYHSLHDFALKSVNDFIIETLTPLVAEQRLLTYPLE